jgi:hypothetical protein
MRTDDKLPGDRRPDEAAPAEQDPRPAYEPPRVLKKRSVSRVTLFTGGGVLSGGLPASG